MRLEQSPTTPSLASGHRVIPLGHEQVLQSPACCCDMPADASTSRCRPPCRMKNLKPEELLVFQHIKASDNMGEVLACQRRSTTQLAAIAEGCHTLCAGMWTKDLKFRTNLQQTQLTRVLRRPLPATASSGVGRHAQ